MQRRDAVRFGNICGEGRKMRKKTKIMKRSEEISFKETKIICPRCKTTIRFEGLPHEIVDIKCVCGADIVKLVKNAIKKKRSLKVEICVSEFNDISPFHDESFGWMTTIIFPIENSITDKQICESIENSIKEIAYRKVKK